MLRCLLLAFIGCCCQILAAQVTVIITDIPEGTPDTDTLYLASKLNDWQAGDMAYAFKKNTKGQYFISIPIATAPLDYKVTRGSWDKEETDFKGRHKSNRTIDQVGDTTFIEIQQWKDYPLNPTKGWIELIINKIPENTPQDAAIYVTGNFNNWTTNDKRYRLEKDKNNTWHVQVPLWQDTLYYKFTRGSWESVEGKPNGQARVNRQFILSEDKRTAQILEIESWEDLAGYPLNIYTIILLLAAIQGVLLIFAINTLQDNNLAANRILSLLILLLSIAIIGRVSTYDRDIFNWLPKLLILPDILYFLYAPLFFLYIQRLLHLPLDSGRYGRQQWLHFIPFILQLIAYYPLLIMPRQAFIDTIVDLDLKPFFAYAGGIALIYNTVYWMACQRYINSYLRTSDNTNSFNSNLEFLRVVMYLLLACLIIWAITYMIGGYGVVQQQNYTHLTDKTTDSMWVVLSLTVFFLGYYSMRQPEIFKLPILEEQEEQGHSEADQADSGLIEEELVQLKEKLEAIMIEEQPYLNPGLTLDELATHINTNRHSLSKVINEGLKMNFNDFVNSYRISEFKSLAVSEKYKNHTFLAIAYIVGFNSKSAFNRSFKKLEQCTPREYLKRVSSEESRG
jgi:AraC-like DNA-binding protein